MKKALEPNRRAARSRLHALALCLTLLICPAARARQADARVDEDARRKTDAALEALGGARAFVAEGATVLTTEGNVKFFERMAAARHALVPDRLAREPRALRVEAFKDKRVVTDGERTVELINVGPNPHTSEMVVVHLPRERIIFQGDLFYFDGEATFPPRNRRTIMPFFARWLVARRLAPERIYGYHDRGFATMEHVRRILAGEGSATGALTTRRRVRARRART